MAPGRRGIVGSDHIWCAQVVLQHEFWVSTRTNAATPETNKPTNGAYNWSASALTFNISTWEIFYLWLYPLNVTQGASSLDTPPIKSHDFILRDPEDAPPTSSSSSTSSLPTSAASSPTSQSPPPSSTTSSPQASTSNQPSHLVPGALAGIGVGIALVVLGLLAAVVWWFRRQQSKQGAVSAAQLGSNTFELPENADRKWRHYHAPVEMEGCPGRTAELSGQSRGWHPAELVS
jgi:hypothetical protein